MPADPVTAAPRQARRAEQLQILGEFSLIVGSQSVDVGTSCQRMLSLLVIKGGRIRRSQAAGMLWPDVRSARASANLRSVLWRPQRCGPSMGEIVNASFHELCLCPSVAVDMHSVTEIANRLLDRSTPMPADALRQATRCNLYEDIDPRLEGEEWLGSERERHHQLRLHALEALGGRLVKAGLHGAAIEAIMHVISADPYRESARELLIRAYLSEGNHIEAHRQYRRYCELLRTDLRMKPPERLARLIASHMAARAPFPAHASPGSCS
jgi:DNA-binding SARP family transcriptional activator